MKTKKTDAEIEQVVIDGFHDLLRRDIEELILAGRYDEAMIVGKQILGAPEKEIKKLIAVAKTKSKELMSETIILSENISASIDSKGGVCITETEGYGYKEFRRYFKNRTNAAKKLRKDMADALASELEDGEMVEAGDAHWDGEPFPLDSALKKLEGN